jgi:hypothetical protein
MASIAVSNSANLNLKDLFFDQRFAEHALPFRDSTVMWIKSKGIRQRYRKKQDNLIPDVVILPYCNSGVALNCNLVLWKANRSRNMRP